MVHQVAKTSNAVAVQLLPVVGVDTAGETAVSIGICGVPTPSNPVPGGRTAGRSAAFRIRVAMPPLLINQYCLKKAYDFTLRYKNNIFNTIGNMKKIIIAVILLFIAFSAGTSKWASVPEPVSNTSFQNIGGFARGFFSR